MSETHGAEPGAATTGGAAKPAARFRQGVRWEGEDPAALAEAIEAAFDYRGNVTVLRRDGADVEGYLANRDATAAEPFVEVFPSDGSARQRVAYADVRGLVFSGKDTASGKSWETWVRKWTAKKEAEARGERVGEIGLFPEEID